MTHAAKRSCAAVAAVLSALLPAAITAQVLVPAHLQEDFAPQVNVSGKGIIVGLAIGELSNHVADPDDLRIALRVLAAVSEACVTANTRDGRYWAELTLRHPVGGTILGKLQPDHAWRYIDDLRKYQRADLAVVVRAGADCTINPNVEYVPIVYEGNGGDILTVAVNSQRAVEMTVELVGPDGSRQRRRCTELDATLRAIAFDSLCRLDIARFRATGGASMLLVHRIMRTGPRSDQFRLRLP